MGGYRLDGLSEHMFWKIFIAITALIVAAAVSVGQVRNAPAHSSGAAWWFNAPSSPLIFGYENRRSTRSKRIEKRGGWLILRNRSDKVITRFRLGCVVKEQGHITVATWAGDSSGDMRPGEFVPAFLDTSNLANEEFGKRLCIAGTKISVTEVYFAEGVAWRAHRLAWGEPRKP